jgi:ABC-type transporter Mla MlaB component
MTQPTLRIENGDDKVRIAALGDWVIQHATEMKTCLANALIQAKDMHLDLSEVTAFDVSAIQVVFLWKNEIKNLNNQIIISMPIDASLLDLLEKSGITKIF